MGHYHPLRFRNTAEWRAWLQANHAMQKEAWLAILKKHAPTPGIFLEQALEGNTEAQANFDKLPASQKKLFLYWIASAKTDKTRQKRIQDTVEMAAKNKRFGEQ